MSCTSTTEPSPTSYGLCYKLFLFSQIKNLSLKNHQDLGSLAFHRDPFNKPEHEITLRGKELVIFVIGYLVAVLCILAIFEAVMPVIFSNYPNGEANTDKS